MATDISLDEIKNETVDLVSNYYYYYVVVLWFDFVGLDFYQTPGVVQEKIPIEEVFAQLKCSREGLSSAEGEKRLQIFGANKLEEKKDNKFLKFLGFMWNPLSWVMESAAIMAIVLANGGVCISSYHNSSFLYAVSTLLIKLN